MPGVVVAGSGRSPLGALGGLHRDSSVAELGANAARAALADAGVEAHEVGCVVFANALPARPEDLSLAAVIASGCGVPRTTPAFAVGGQEASGLQAVQLAAALIAAGEADVVLAGGAELPSGVPYWAPGVRFGQREDDTVVVDPLAAGLAPPTGHGPLGLVADELAEARGIGREAQDAFAWRSYELALAARREDDELPPPGLSRERLEQLKPVFRADGTVTSGNGAPLADGAAAVVLCAAGRGRGAVLAASVQVGLRAKEAPLAAAVAAREALERAGLAPGALEAVELHESSAAHALTTVAELGLDVERVNLAGGAIAQGNPVAASGLLLVGRLAASTASGAAAGLVAISGADGIGAALVLGRQP